MKTILVLTDFSISADYTAQYALALAQNIKANLLVCNIYQTPGGQDIAAHSSWPFQTEEENSINDLGAVVAHLKTRLDMQKDSKSYRPEIEQCSVEGSVGGQFPAILSKYNVILAMVSAHSRGDFIGSLSKDNAWAIIDNASFPVLVIPYQVKFKPFTNIAYANVTIKPDEEHGIKQFFDKLPFKISYHHIKQLSAPGDIDLLVIVHHKRNFFQKLFNGSMTRKLATHSTKPLLVFPVSAVKETLSILLTTPF